MKRTLAVLLLPLAALAQPAPKFEVVSVKLHELQPGMFVARNGAAGISLSGNRVTVGGTLTSIVMAAYNLKEFQVSGGPDWTDQSWSVLYSRRRLASSVSLGRRDTSM